MDNTVLNNKESEILNFIKEQIIDKGYPPSLREICRAVSLKSPSSVHAYLSSLEDKGYIKRASSKSRTIEIVDDEFNLTRREIRNMPVIGNVAAGTPIFAEQNITGYLSVSSSDLPAGDLYVLQVRGESMINAGIFDGDKVIVKQADTARNGDIVVALIEDGATVKTFYKENNGFRLQPENDDYEPIYVNELKIMGIVVGLMRIF